MGCPSQDYFPAVPERIRFKMIEIDAGGCFTGYAILSVPLEKMFTLAKVFTEDNPDFLTI